MMRKLLFTLACAMVGSMSYAQVISSFPYTEDFETQVQGPTGCGPAYTVIGNTWQNGDDAALALPLVATHQIDWTSDVGGTGSSNTGPSVDHTLGTNTGHYMYAETSCSGSGYPAAEFDLVSPYMDFTALTTPEFTFWYHEFGTTMGNLSVDVQVTSTGTWTTVWGPVTDNIDLWQEGTVLLAAYAGMDSVRIRMNYISGTSFGGDIGLDDLTVSQPAPYDVAGLGFLAGSCGTGPTPVTVEFQCAGADTIVAGDTIYLNYNDGITAFEDTLILALPCAPGDTITHTFSQLINYVVSTPINMMAYSEYFGDSLTNGNDTIWTTVNPIPIISSFPYLENFEAGQGGWVEDNTNNGSWAFGTPAKTVIIGAASGVNAWTSGGLTGDYNANENSWVNGPCFDFSTLDSGSYVSLKVWWNSEFSWDGSNIQWSSDDGASWNNIGAFGSPNNWYTDNTINGNPGGNGSGWTGRDATANGSGGWIQAKHLLPDTLVGMPSARLRFTFGADGSVQDDGVAFDDFSIGLPDSLDSALFVDYNGCSPLDIDYLETGFYSWAIQDTATLAIDTTFYTYSGAMSFLQSGATDTTFNLIVNYVDASGCFPHTDTMLFTIAPTPDVNLGADTSICWNASVQYNAPIGVDYTYLWSDLSVADSALFTTGGYIGVTVTDTISGCAATDSAWIIQTSAVDIPAVTANVCAGDSIMVDAGAPYDVYAWSTSEATQTVYLSTPGTYYVTATDSIGCMSTDSVEITTSLPVPAITGVVDTICSNGSMVLDAGAGFSSYSWTTSGSAQTETISGASLPLGDNTVTVTVTDGNGCSNTDAVTFNIDGCAGLDDLNAIAMSIYPNPSTGEFTYAIENMTGDINMMITDLSGKIIDAGKINASTGIIDLTNYENGIYILRLQAGNAITSVRLVKQ